MHQASDPKLFFICAIFWVVAPISIEIIFCRNFGLNLSFPQSCVTKCSKENFAWHGGRLGQRRMFPNKTYRRPWWRSTKWVTRTADGVGVRCGCGGVWEGYSRVDKKENIRDVPRNKWRRQSDFSNPLPHPFSFAPLPFNCPVNISP